MVREGRAVEADGHALSDGKRTMARPRGALRGRAAPSAAAAPAEAAARRVRLVLLLLVRAALEGVAQLAGEERQVGMDLRLDHRTQPKLLHLR